jgi:hypothetical protein
MALLHSVTTILPTTVITSVRSRPTSPAGPHKRPIPNPPYGHSRAYQLLLKRNPQSIDSPRNAVIHCH